METGRSEGRSSPTVQAVGRALFWLGLGHVVGQVWWYGSLIFLAALVGPKDFGTVAAGLVVVQIAQLLMDSGTRGSLIVAPTLSVGLIRRALAFNIGVGTLLTVAIAGAAQPFVDAFVSGGQAGPIRLLALSVVLSSFVPVPMALLQRALDFKRQATVLGAAATLASLVSVAAALLDAGIWALVIRQVIYQGVIATISWWSVRRLLPVRLDGSAPEAPLRQQQFAWFFLLSLSQFLALNVDYLVVGAFTDARQLGLYSLAFTIAFAPVTQVSWQIAKVVLPAAAATDDRALVARRALKATRLLAAVTVPFVPPAVVLAPTVLPAVFGTEWTTMVLPFQILLVSAVGHVLLSVVQETLAGTGSVPFFATTSIIWLGCTVLTLVMLVRLDDIRGAALTHLILLVPLGAVYLTGGARRIGLKSRTLVGGLGGILGCVALQSMITAGGASGLPVLGASSDVARGVGAALGLAVVVVLMFRLKDSPVIEARGVIRAMRHRAA